MDDAGAKLEARAEPIYHPVWGKDADELTLAPFTQNSGHPQLGKRLFGQNLGAHDFSILICRCLVCHFVPEVKDLSGPCA